MYFCRPQFSLLSAPVSQPPHIGFAISTLSVSRARTRRCLTNIASSCSRHTRTILDAAPQLISFLSAPNPALQEQALWALGNIAGDSGDFREMLHANGALLPILRLLQHPPVIKVYSSCWARVCACCLRTFVIPVLFRGERASENGLSGRSGSKLFGKGVKKIL